MRYTEARQIVEAAINEMATSNASAVKELRAKIDHHAEQTAAYSSLYNRSMNAHHRAQAYAHGDALSAAIKAHKKLTGKSYYGKPNKNPVTPTEIQTNGNHYGDRIGSGGFVW